MFKKNANHLRGSCLLRSQSSGGATMAGAARFQRRRVQTGPAMTLRERLSDGRTREDLRFKRPFGINAEPDRCLLESVRYFAGDLRGRLQEFAQ